MQTFSQAEQFTQDGEPLAIDVMMSGGLPDLTATYSSDAVEPDQGEYAFEDEFDEPVEGVKEADALKPARRTRKEPVQMPVLADGEKVSVYQALVAYGLLKKLTDIVLAKAQIPWHLREDATQEVHAAWAALPAKTEFARNQLARYAYMSGEHAALKLRRNIGAVVAIPGALFRTGRDSAFMEAIGAAVNPKDVDEYKDSIELSVEAEEYSSLPQQVSQDYFKVRIEGLSLSKSQRAVAERVLVRRMSVSSIASELGVRETYVERLIAQVTQMVTERDDRAMGRTTRTKQKKASKSSAASCEAVQ